VNEYALEGWKLFPKVLVGCGKHRFKVVWVDVKLENKGLQLRMVVR